MAYCTASDVAVAAGGHDALVELCDLANERDRLAVPMPMPPAGAAVLEEAIADADALLDSYIAKQRAVPLLPVPRVVRRVSAEETVYLLRIRRQMVGDFEQAKHDANVKWMEGVARGANTLGVDPQPPKSALVAPAVVLVGDFRIDASKLRGFY